MGNEMNFTFSCNCRMQMDEKMILLSLLAGQCLSCGTPMKKAEELSEDGK